MWEARCERARGAEGGTADAISTGGGESGGDTVLIKVSRKTEPVVCVCTKTFIIRNWHI